MQNFSYSKIADFWVVTVAVCVLLLAAGAGCSLVGSGEPTRAELKDKDGKSVGMASLVEAGGGVRIHLEVTGLSPGLHAVHIHAVGKCDAPGFTSAGGHFNPAQRKHGHRSQEGAHAGDLPNMLVAKNGSGRFEVFTDGVTLRAGPLSIFDADGSALIVHAGVDDYATDPTGDAGDRAACGVIAARN
jgi:superoxide dismutase, Cu-Zn family